MYLYSKDGLGDCPKKWTEVGSGRTQIGAQHEVCPLLRDQAGGFIDWQNYLTRRANSSHPLSKFKQFLNEDCYRAYLESCKVSAEDERKNLRPLAPGRKSALQRRLESAWERLHPGPWLTPPRLNGLGGISAGIGQPGSLGQSAAPMQLDPTPLGPLRARRPSPGPTPQLRFPPFETIVGFVSNYPTLNGRMLAAIKRVAEFIASSAGTSAPFSVVRCVGYKGRDEASPDLGLRRAQEAQFALRNFLKSLNPGLLSSIRWLADDCGYSATFVGVEIYLWAGGGAPAPAPCAVRVPSPAEMTASAPPPRPETPQERINRILRTLPPKAPPGRSFDQWFRQKVDGALDSTMRRLGVPTSLRGPIRNSVYAAVSRGAEEILKQALAAAELKGEAQKAIIETVRTLAKKPAP